MKNMKQIAGIKFISEKEAIQRYGYSSTWFQTRRYKEKEPIFIKTESGKVYYQLDKTDQWFKDFFKIDE
jgi:hypothetical protein